MQFKKNEKVFCEQLSVCLNFKIEFSNTEGKHGYANICCITISLQMFIQGGVAMLKNNSVYFLAVCVISSVKLRSLNQKLLYLGMGILGLQGSLNILIWKLQLRVASTYHGRYFFFMFRDCRQITFVTLNGFCPFNLKPKPPSPPPLYEQYQNG